MFTISFLRLALSFLFRTVNYFSFTISLVNQGSLTFLAPQTGFVEDKFFHRPGGGSWFWDYSVSLHLLCTLFLLLLHYDM